MKKIALFYSLLSTLLFAQNTIITPKVGSWTAKDSVQATGLQTILQIHFGGVFAGNQAHSGIVSEKGDPTSTSKGGLGFALRYFPISPLGIEFVYSRLYSSIQAYQTRPMDFSQQNNYDIGLALIPWGKRFSRKLFFQTTLSGGLNYINGYKLDSEYTDFVSENAHIYIPVQYANGYGWYSSAGLRLIFKFGLQIEAGIKFTRENPKFKNALETIDAYTISGLTGVGYKF